MSAQPSEFDLALVVVLATVGGTLVAILFSHPFEGAMIRLRAHYAPRSISLDGEETRTNPQLHGIFGTLQRTMALEGWWGLYKGAYATAITALIAILPYLSVTVYQILTHGAPGAAPVPATLTALRFPVGMTTSLMRKIPRPALTAAGYESQARLDIMSKAVAVAVVLAVIPFMILINRAIVTPYRLPLSVSGTFRILFTKRERRYPFLLFCAPGLVLATLLSLLPILALNTVMTHTPLAPRDGLTRAIVYVALSGLSAAIIVPLKVVIVRVSVQPTLARASGEGEAALLLAENEQDTLEIPDIARCSTSDEDVLALRPPLPRYPSLVGALRTIAAEEGWQALYRGWIWTALGLVIGAMGQVPGPRFPHPTM